MSDKDQEEWEEWIRNRADLYSLWCAKEGFVAACAYKDKRIAELEAHITDLQETVSALMDHIGPHGMKTRGRRG